MGFHPGKFTYTALRTMVMLRHSLIPPYTAQNLLHVRIHRIVHDGGFSEMLTGSISRINPVRASANQCGDMTHLEGKEIP